MDMSPIRPPMTLDECGSIQDRKRVFQYYAKIGDPSPVAEWLGTKYVPPTLPEGLDLDGEWQQHHIHAARWIKSIYERIYERPDRVLA